MPQLNLYTSLSYTLPSLLTLLTKKMKGSICSFLLLALQIVSLVSAASRPFAPNDKLYQPGPAQAPAAFSSFFLGSKKESMSIEDVSESEIKEELAYGDGVRKMGSSPPSCMHKCYGCTPCEAIQVPKTTKRNHLGVQYANYEPEGWKCKCGPSLYSP